jgi:hypothetical protein
MYGNNIASLRPEGRCPPLEVRLIRRWFPRWRLKEACYLFVDAHVWTIINKIFFYKHSYHIPLHEWIQGDAIQATGIRSHLRIVDNSLHLQRCYRISGYACTATGNYRNVIAKNTLLRIGPGLKVENVTDEESIPRNYFEFSSYENLATRSTQEDLLTGMKN